ncbi:hypothetical protein [Terriglobus sp. ADX1]|uniref:hypothetical protein n=1 Tax=Terriglobus sp. ADX1 TaxID=2794063 RepID=UPI002FE6385F
MSAFWDHKEELEKYEFMMGVERGRLAVAMDVLTDALALVGQHGVYCTSNRNPTVPALDIQAVMRGINDAKELIGSSMEEIRKKREASQAAG